MKRVFQVSAVAASIAVGVFVGFVAVSNMFNEANLSRFGHFFKHSKEKMGEMSEEVAVKKAKLTNNPRVNQDWVAKQWDLIGY